MKKVSELQNKDATHSLLNYEQTTEWHIYCKNKQTADSTFPIQVTSLTESKSLDACGPIFVQVSLQIF